MLENETFYFYLTRNVLLSYFFSFFFLLEFRNHFAFLRERGKKKITLLFWTKIKFRILLELLLRCVDVKFFLICFWYNFLINIYFFLLFLVARRICYSWLPTFEIFFFSFNQRNCNCPHTRNRSLVVTTEVQQTYSYLNCITHFRLSRAPYWNFF